MTSKPTTAAAASSDAARTLQQVLRIGSSGQLSVESLLTVESLAYSMLLAGPAFAAWLQRRGPMAHRENTGAVVEAELGDDAVRVTLRRPEVHNALDAQMRVELCDALRAAATHDRPVVLAGEGATFCSGGDLSQFGATPDVVTAHRLRLENSPAHLLAAIADRVEARVHGTCVGAGVELAAFASHVSANRDTTFRLPEVEMGLIPGAGGTVSIPARIGVDETLNLCVSGRQITADDALRMGLVDEIV